MHMWAYMCESTYECFTFDATCKPFASVCVIGNDIKTLLGSYYVYLFVECCAKGNCQQDERGGVRNNGHTTAHFTLDGIGHRDIDIEKAEARLL